MPWRTASISRAPVSVSTKSIGLIPLSAGAGALSHSATAASDEKIERANVWIRAIRTNFSEFSEESRTFFLRWSRMVRGDIPSFAASSSTVRDRTLAAASKDPAGNPTRMRSMAEVGGILATWKAEGGTRLASGNNAVFSSNIAAICVRAHSALAVGSFCVFSPAGRRGWHSTDPVALSRLSDQGSLSRNDSEECRAVACRRAAGRRKNAAWRQAPAHQRAVSVISFVEGGPTLKKQPLLGAWLQAGWSVSEKNSYQQKFPAPHSGARGRCPPPVEGASARHSLSQRPLNSGLSGNRERR